MLRRKEVSDEKTEKIKEEKQEGCIDLSLHGTASEKKKYGNPKRKGPPYPGNDPDCHGQTRRGNDGQLYESKPNKKGVYSWKKV